jgi:hypothetical protein
LRARYPVCGVDGPNHDLQTFAPGSFYNTLTSKPVMKRNFIRLVLKSLLDHLEVTDC